jgi:hypothetical protein
MPRNQSNDFLDHAWDLQDRFEFRVSRWIRRIGPGFIVGLFGFSLIAEGFIGILYYQLCDRGIKYLINGDPSTSDPGPPLFLNPVMIVVWGFMIILILLLEKRAKLTHK